MTPTPRHPGEGRGPDGVRAALMASLLILAACATTREANVPTGLTPKEEAALDAAAELLDDGEVAVPLTEAQLQTYPGARGMPADVQAFMVRWLDCDHWLGEEPYDEERRREIDAAVQVTCPGLDEEGRLIRSRYADNPEVLARLRDFEPLNQ